MPEAPGAPAAAPAAPPAPPPAQDPPKKKDASPRLPGVVPDDFGDIDAPPKRKIAPIRDQRPAIDRIAQPETPERGPNGRFLPREGVEAQPGAEVDAPDAPAADPDQAETPAEEPAAEKFRFGGMEFESQAAAEQYFKSALGQQKARVAAEERAKTATTRAIEWKNEAERLRQENAQLRNGKGAPATAPTTSPQPSSPVTAPNPSDSAATAAATQKAFEEAVDWELHKELYETKGPEYAQYWLMREFRTFTENYVKSQLEQVTKPLQEQQAVLQTLHSAADLFTRVSSFEDPESGEPYYPELRDPQAQETIARLWVDLGFDVNGEKPELGVHYAVLTYRDWVARQGKAGGARTPSPTPPAAPAAPVLDGLAAAREAASTVLSGTGTPRPASPEATPELRLKKAIREADAYMPGLGFAP